MADDEAKQTQNKYEILAFSYWYYPVFLLLYLSPLILFLVKLDEISEVMSDVGAGTFLLAMVVSFYFVASYLSTRLTRRPVRVSFDDQQITVENFSRDLSHIIETATCQLKDVISFHDHNLTGDSFRLKLVNGDTFALHLSGWQKKDNDLQRLVKDFKQHVQHLNPTNSADAIKHEDFISSFWGRTTYRACVVIAWAGLGLLLYVVFFKDPFEWQDLKLPVGMLFTSLGYISKYSGWADDDE